jgi:hypothetical protein
MSWIYEHFEIGYPVYWYYDCSSDEAAKGEGERERDIRRHDGHRASTLRSSRAGTRGILREHGTPRAPPTPTPYDEQYDNLIELFKQ